MVHTVIITRGLLLSLLFYSCSSKGQIKKSGIVQMKTHFYNAKASPTFTHYLKIWYNDSTAVEEIRGIHTVTDTANITTVTYPLLFCRYMNLRDKAIYDYTSFSDTAKLIKKEFLPDSLMDDAGWSFYSEKAYIMRDEPLPIDDTTIDNVSYKRVKFNFKRDVPQKQYMIGYFRCDGKDDMFSLEKPYSRKINCTMVKYFDYQNGKSTPFASIEVFYLSDSLSKEETKVFEAWERNARQNPVNK